VRSAIDVRDAEGLPLRDAAALVTALYRDVVGRDPDEEGLRHYVARLCEGPTDVGIPSVVHDITSSAESERVRIGAALSAAARGVLAARPDARPVIALGTHCYTASLLKSAGVKTSSYPFDWIFASPDMVAHCLDDDFAAFLDKRYYEYVPVERRRDGPTVNLCDHALYRDRYGVAFVFNHRNPLSETDYEYVTRCVERFRAAVRGGPTLLLLVTHHSPEWERGFERVSRAVRSYAPSARLAYVVVDDERHAGVPAVDTFPERDGHTLLSLASGSRWRSLFFENPLDDITVLVEALRRV